MLRKILTSLTFFSTLALASTSFKQIEIRQVHEKASSQTIAMTSQEDGKKFNVDSQTFLSIDDFTDANVTLTEGAWVLNVTMKEPAAKKMQAFSRAHVGTALAFIIDGKILQVPHIKDPILGKGLLIGAFSKTKADELAAIVNKRK